MIFRLRRSKSGGKYSITDLRNRYRLGIAMCSTGVLDGGRLCFFAFDAVAEMMRFFPYRAYTFIAEAFIYPVVGHWAWNSSG